MIYASVKGHRAAQAGGGTRPLPFHGKCSAHCFLPWSLSFVIEWAGDNTRIPTLTRRIRASSHFALPPCLT